MYMHWQPMNNTLVSIIKWNSSKSNFQKLFGDVPTHVLISQSRKNIGIFAVEQFNDVHVFAVSEVYIII